MREANDEVAFTMLETLGRLRYPSDATRDEVEAFLVAQTRRYELTNAFRLLGAAKGLEVLIRQQSKREISGDTRLRLRELTAAGSPGAPIPTIAGPGRIPVEGDTEWHARVRRLALLTSANRARRRRPDARTRDSRHRLAGPPARRAQAQHE